MRKLDAFFYILLGILTFAVLIMLALWVRTKNNVYLYLMLAAFALYSFHIIFTLVRGGKDLHTGEAFRSKFLLLLNHVDSKIVYITYLGNERRIFNPAGHRKDYLVEFYEPGTDLEKLKKHIWFDLPEEDEKELRKKCIGEIEIPHSFLADIKGRKVLLQSGFLQVAKNLKIYTDFLKNNEIISYGE